MSYRNREYYADPTAALAIRRAQREARGAGPRAGKKEAGKRPEGNAAGNKGAGTGQARGYSGPREGWEALAGAVVLDAVGEYREARAQLRYPARRKRAEAEIGRLEKFFRSQWFAGLAGIDGEALIERLRRENE